MGSATYQGGSHLTFKKMPLRKGAKLHRYKIINHHFDYEIGEIHWRGGWHQYVSQTKPEIDVSRSCHKEIIMNNSGTLKTFWPVFIAITGIAVSWGGLLAWAEGAKSDIEKIEATYVTDRVLKLELGLLAKDIKHNQDALVDLKEGQHDIINLLKVSNPAGNVR